MKIPKIALILIIVVAGCASSNNSEETEGYPHLVTLQQPGDQPYDTSRVYIDSVKVITRNQQALLIHGTFPDACTKIRDVSHTIDNDSLKLSFSAWRNPEKMCAQVLTPFSFIYNKLTEKELRSHSKIFVNNTPYNY